MDKSLADLSAAYQSRDQWPMSSNIDDRRNMPLGLLYRLFPGLMYSMAEKRSEIPLAPETPPQGALSTQAGYLDIWPR